MYLRYKLRYNVLLYALLLNLDCKKKQFLTASISSIMLCTSHGPRAAPARKTPRYHTGKFSL
jgi:hypothetical protein